MSEEYWYKQTKEKPLFPDLLWSRPENKQAAGKLLIIGGNAHGFASAAEAYQEAAAAGIGSAKVLLPDALQKTVGRVLENGEYAPITPSGSFSKKALTELLEFASWSDGVIIAGDLGRNSETSALLEQFIQRYPGQLTITKDAVEYLNSFPKLISQRERTTLVLSLSQLQRLSTELRFQRPFLLSMGLLLLVQALHEFTETYGLRIVTKELDNLVASYKGRVSTTKTEGMSEDLWRVKTAAKTTVFQIQNPTKPFEAISAGLLADA
jgi:hypothetical protein